VSRELARKVADAVLYEGYMLYPYRPSALKNQQRWTFGILYPPAYNEVARGTERSRMHTECLLRANGEASVRIELRFLHLQARQILQRIDKRFEPVPSLIVDGKLIESWGEGIERSIEFDVLVGMGPERFDFCFDERHDSRDLTGMGREAVGRIHQAQEEVRGNVSVRFDQVRNGLWKLTIEVTNKSRLNADVSTRSRALLRSLLSAHCILEAEDGGFVSLLDPPADCREAVERCVNIGNVPVLVGEEGKCKFLLCSPITLYDYPKIAPESAEDFYDATEMDEMLTLRVITLTDEEKKEASMTDERVRKLLERTEQTAREQLMRTHGTIRNLPQ
jgi:hydrogenase maturation protease